MIKRYEQKYSIILALTFLVFGLIACHYQIIVDTNQASELKIGSPLKGIGPLTFFIEPFTSARHITGVFTKGKFQENGPNYIGYDAIGYNTKTYLADKPITQVVETAIGKELQRNGHVLIDSTKQKEADVIISGVVYKYDINTNATSTTNHYSAEVSVRIIASLRNNPDSSISKIFNGSKADQSAWGLKNETLGIMTNEALRNMLADFTNDPELIEFLKKVKCNNEKKEESIKFNK